MPASTSTRAARSTAKKMIEAGSSSRATRRSCTACSARPSAACRTRAWKETLEKAGLKVDYIEISPEVERRQLARGADPGRLPRKNPDVKAIGTQHGGVTRVMRKALKQAGKKPGDVVVGGIDLAPATIDGLEKGWISVTLDQQLYLQGFLPVTAMRAVGEVRLHGREREHRCRRRHPADDRRAGAADREGDPLTPRNRGPSRRLEPMGRAAGDGWCGRSWRRAPASGRSRPLENAPLRAGPTSSLPGSRPRSSC